MREIKMDLNKIGLTTTNLTNKTNKDIVKRKETTTQRKRRLEKERRKRQEKLANETEQEKRIRLNKRKMRLKNESQEQREARLNSYRERYIRAHSQETPQQREKRLLADRKWHAQSRLIKKKLGNGKLNETTTQRKGRLEKAKQYAKRKYEEKRANDSLKNKEKILNIRRTRSQNESIEKHNQRLQQINQLNSHAKSMKTSSQCSRILQTNQQNSQIGATKMPLLHNRCCRSQRLQQMRQNISQLLKEPDLINNSLVKRSSESLQYSLADLQRAMGASDGEMAMLKQLGEIKNLSLFPDSEICSDKPDELLADHTGKEVICPTCFCHFMGFPALQLHISKCHPTSQNNNQYNTIVSILSKRSQIESSEKKRLVCFMCQQILPDNLMSSHLVVEHSSKPIDISKYQSIGDPIHNDNNDEGEKFKYKMFDALGDLLDRAANNLITAKQDSNNGMSDIAVQLLTNLCALKKKETPHQRLHPSTKEMLLKVFDKYCFEAEQKKGATNCLKIGNFTCRICGESFSWDSKAIWRRHVLETHARPCVMSNMDDLSTDHNEAIGAEGELLDDGLKSQLPLSDDKNEESSIFKSTDIPARSSVTEDSSTVSTDNCSNSNDISLRKVTDNISPSTSQTTTLSQGGNQSSSQSSIIGPLNKGQRKTKRQRIASPGSYKRKRLSRIKEDKSAKKRAEDALRELNLAQKVDTANKISSGKPVRFRFGIDQVQK